MIDTHTIKITRQTDGSLEVVAVSRDSTTEYDLRGGINSVGTIVEDNNLVGMSIALANGEDVVIGNVTHCPTGARLVGRGHYGTCRACKEQIAYEAIGGTYHCGCGVFQALCMKCKQPHNIGTSQCCEDCRGTATSGD